MIHEAGNRRAARGVQFQVLRWFSLAVAGCALAAAPSPEARVEREGSRARLVSDSPRPLHAAAEALATQFGLRVNVEDPPYIHKDDVKDVTEEVSRVPNPRRRILVPRGGRLEVEFALRPGGSPRNVRALLESLVAQANARFSFAYRLEAGNRSFTLVPTHTRDQFGRVVKIVPLLDRRVAIPAGKRPLAESARLMAESLSAQTGRRVSCCQAFVAGVPWGLEEVFFAARDEPARSVLERLIEAGLQGRPNPYYWLQACDPLPSPWCFVNLIPVPAAGDIFSPGLGNHILQRPDAFDLGPYPVAGLE